MRVLTLAGLFAGGLLAAGVVAAAGNAQATETTTETLTETTTVHETTTLQETTTAGTTVVTTETVAPTTTGAPATTPTTTAEATSTSTTPTWVWVVLGLLAAAVVGLAVALFTRRGPPVLPEAERRRRMQTAVDSWTAQGWALVNETADTAVLQRGGERMTVSVDPAGQVSARLISTQPPT